MARTRKQDVSHKPFMMPDCQTKPITTLRGIPPQNQAAAQVMADPSKREYAGNLLLALSDAYRMEPVRSNRELAERIEDYFRFCGERQILPTMEGMALYCGFSRQTFNDWLHDRNHGFADRFLGFSTSDVVKKASTFLQAFDADMAMNGRVTPVSYIFRAKANWAYCDDVTVEITSDNGLKPPMTPEEIARNLPEITRFEYEGGESDG